MVIVSPLTGLVPLPNGRTSWLTRLFQGHVRAEDPAHEDVHEGPMEKTWPKMMAKMMAKTSYSKTCATNVGMFFSFLANCFFFGVVLPHRGPMCFPWQMHICQELIFFVNQKIFISCEPKKNVDLFFVNICISWLWQNPFFDWQTALKLGVGITDTKVVDFLQVHPNSRWMLSFFFFLGCGLRDLTSKKTSILVTSFLKKSRKYRGNSENPNRQISHHLPVTGKSWKSAFW